MTRRLPFAKANIRRRVEAAHENGLCVIAIKNDGTLVVSERPDPLKQEQEATVLALAVAP